MIRHAEPPADTTPTFEALGARVVQSSASPRTRPPTCAPRPRGTRRAAAPRVRGVREGPQRRRPLRGGEAQRRRRRGPADHRGRQAQGGRDARRRRPHLDDPPRGGRGRLPSERANAARAAADFETTLAQRRQRSEKEFMERSSGRGGRDRGAAGRSDALRQESERAQREAASQAAQDVQDAARRPTRSSRKAEQRGRQDPGGVRARARRLDPAPGQHQRPAHQRL